MASEESQIRKFRKKLRQIEHLESVRRELTQDELKKVATKDIIRGQLQVLLSQILQESEPVRVSHVSRNRFKLPASPRERSLIDDEPCYAAEGSSGNDSRCDNSSGKKKRKLPDSDLEELQNINNEGLSNGKQAKIEESGTSADSAFKTAPVAVGPVVEPTTSSRVLPIEEDARKKYRELERAKVFARELEGHSDIVWALASQKNFLVSGSRDTTGRVWDLEAGEEVCSLRGHTGSVNGVALLSRECTQELAAKLECQADQIALTGSADCSIKLWAIPSGLQLKSIYTFNSITCMGFFEDVFFAITGTDGGKIEVWDVISGGVIQSNNAHDDSVTCLEVSGNQLCSGSMDGIVIVWLLVNNKLQIAYKLEPDENKNIEDLKCLKSVSTHYGRVFLGDTGATIKVLSWRRDRMHSVKNHTLRYGCTDALITFDDLLVSSSYNLDSGLGSINIRLLPEVEYICSIHEQTHKILCLSCTRRNDGGIRLISGGLELVVWDLMDGVYKESLERYNIADVLDVCHLNSLDYEPEKIESEVETSEATDDDQDSVAIAKQNLSQKAETSQRNSWTSWCSLV